MCGDSASSGYAVWCTAPDGATDELGYRSVENVVTVHDLHATVLHQMGLSHKKLTYRHQGHDESLTDSRVTAARVVGDLLTNDVQPV
ncbi:MAG: hypothetical protein CMJ59_24435 [Planctomycetaceae bacterium]|nr:hypothetical protein [Planctomycetaceae bacterium]